MTSEKALERALVDWAKTQGGKAVKLTSQFERGLPDRIVLLPTRRVFFVEVKSTGEKPRKLQHAQRRALQALGFSVWVLDSAEVLTEIKRTYGNY